MSIVRQEQLSDAKCISLLQTIRNKNKLKNRQSYRHADPRRDCLDKITHTHQHPHSGAILAGDFNKLRDTALVAYPLKQVVRSPTRGSVICTFVILVDRTTLRTSTWMTPQWRSSYLDKSSVACNQLSTILSIRPVSVT